MALIQMAIEGSVGTIVLNNPRKRNAFSRQSVDRIVASLT